MNPEAVGAARENPGTSGDHAVFVTSIGTASASIIGALEQATSLHGQLLAHRLFQAPSILFGNLAEPLATDVVHVLRRAGVECEVVPKGHRFVQGDSDHEIALFIRDAARMQAILEGVMTLLGVGVREAKEIVCATPAVLMGRVSAATVEAVRRRFEGLGVEVDVSRSDDARFDAFLSDESCAARASCEKLVDSLGLSAHAPPGDAKGPLLAEDLPRSSAEQLHAQAARGKHSIVVLSRDFQRFDVRLEAAPDSPEMTKFLVETAGMPERIVPKVLARLPIVTHPGVRHAAMREHLQAIEALGGKATGHLISFQRFGLVVDAVKDAKITATLLRDLGGLSQAEIDRAARGRKEPVGALSGTLARWLVRELELQGTQCRMVLR